MAKKDTQKNRYDVIIIGGGPAGLALASSLERHALKIAVIEKQPLSILENPVADGRDTALTHLSKTILTELGIWTRLAKADISPIRHAHVLNGNSTYFLEFTHEKSPHDELGYLVPNNMIRKAAYEEAAARAGIEIMPGVEATDIETNGAHGHVTLDNGKTLQAPLIVAADSRFSPARKKMGIATDMTDFKRSIIVCRMHHEKPHHETAYECFNYERTLAVLPLNNNTVSIVVTLPQDQADDMMQMDEEAFCELIAAQFDRRLGKMTQAGKRHLYPLAGVYAEKFYATRFALVGDAAVGMHPVTAHGYNFGLKGGDILSRKIAETIATGGDIGSLSVLRHYHTKHRQATRPLYLATNALVKLYTAETPMARIARHALLHLGNALPPVKRLITGSLTETPKREKNK